MNFRTREHENLRGFTFRRQMYAVRSRQIVFVGRVIFKNNITKNTPLIKGD